RRRHTRFSRDWSSDVCSSDLKGMKKRLEQMYREADQAIAAGAEFIIITDRDSDQELAPIPSLLAVSAVHHHLIRQETRMKASLRSEERRVGKGCRSRRARED